MRKCRDLIYSRHVVLFLTNFMSYIKTSDVSRPDRRVFGMQNGNIPSLNTFVSLTNVEKTKLFSREEEFRFTTIELVILFNIKPSQIRRVIASHSVFLICVIEHRMLALEVAFPDTLKIMNIFSAVL